MRLEHDLAAALYRWSIGERVRELLLAMGVKSKFEFLDAAQTPVAIDDDLDQFAFVRADGLQIALEGCEKGRVFFDIVGRQEDCAAGESGLDGVLGGFSKAGFGTGTGAFLRIGTICGKLGWGNGADLSYWHGSRFVRCRVSRS